MPIPTIIAGVIGIALAAMPVNAAPLVSAAFLAPNAVVSEDKRDLGEEVVRTLKVTVTAYSSTPDQTDSTPFTTANGQRVRDGIIAANFLPFGTRVRFPELYGDKVFTVQDRMHPRFPNRADIWMETREEAKRLGLKRNVMLEVLPKAPGTMLGR